MPESVSRQDRDESAAISGAASGCGESVAARCQHGYGAEGCTHPDCPNAATEIPLAANVRRLLDDVQKGGQVWIQTVNQADGPYCTVSGLGVHAGGYRTVDDAIAAWLDARDFDALQAKLDNEEAESRV